MAKKSIFTYRIEEDLLTKIKLIAYEKGIPLNTLLHSFIIKYIEYYEQENGIITPKQLELMRTK